MIDLLKDLEQQKERELRAQIEKEEIAHALKNVDKKSLNNLERDKRREIEKLGAERESLRLREHQLIAEI